MELQDGTYLRPRHLKSINTLIWDSIKDCNGSSTKKERFVSLLYEILGTGFSLHNGAEEDSSLSFTDDEQVKLNELTHTIFELKKSCDRAEKECNYCNGKGFHQSYEGGDWHTSSCHKCNPDSPWYENDQSTTK